jgi:hypothetical protein
MQAQEEAGHGGDEANHRAHHADVIGGSAQVSRTIQAVVQAPPVDRVPTRSVLLCAVATFCAGLVVLALVPVIFGTPRPMLHVAWNPVSDREREALEARFSLAEGRPKGPGEFVYVPEDVTPSTLAALAAHPAILATAGIDRRTGTIDASAPLTARRGGLVTSARAARAARAAGVALAALGVALATAGIVLTGKRASTAHARWSRYRQSPGRFGRDTASAAFAWIERGIPTASPAAAGVFRIVFVACVLAIAVLEPASQRPIPPDAAEAGGPYGLAVQWMAASPSSLRLVDGTLWVSGALAIAGLATRIAFAVCAGAFVLWASAFTTHTTLHTVSALQVTLICLTAAPWGDAWSLDAWIRRRRTGAAPEYLRDRRHGFCVWVPAFVLGVAYLAAAWAKVGHGPDWILNGTVRQHFLTDLDHAWTSWGPVLTSTPVAAVALSAAAIVVEAAAISAALVPSWRFRLAIGGSVLALLTGFALFQGIVWPAWWVLLLGFLPWQLLSGRNATTAPGAPGSLTATQRGAIVLVLVGQIGASFVMRDFRPFISGYDMYATTHGPEIDNARGFERVRVVTSAAGGWRDIPACAIDLPVMDDAAAAHARAAFPAHLAACLAAEPADTIRLDLDRQTYDWSAHALQWRTRVDVAGPFRRSELPTTWPFRQ